MRMDNNRKKTNTDTDVADEDGFGKMLTDP